VLLTSCGCSSYIIGLLTRIHQTIPQVGVILERAGVTHVVGIAGVNTSAPGCDHVVGVKTGTVVELYTLAEGADPLGQISIGFAAGRENRFHITGFGLVAEQGFQRLPARCQRFTIGLIRAIEADGFCVLHADDGIFA